MSTEIANVNTLICKVISDPNVDVEKMSQVLDMQERIFNKNAEIEFNKAMSATQAEMPTVVRDAMNSQTNSKYAKLESILHSVTPTITKHGFSLSFGTDKSPLDGYVRITCSLMHSGGHSRPFHVDLPIDNTGAKGNVNKTVVHGIGSTFSYGKRYLITMIFNIAIANEDDDAVKAGNLTIQDLLEYNHNLSEHLSTMAVVRESLSLEEPDFAKASEEWYTLEIDMQRKLWRAPSKGGVFTTAMIKTMQSVEFREAYFGKES